MKLFSELLELVDRYTIRGLHFVLGCPLSLQKRYRQPFQEEEPTEKNLEQPSCPIWVLFVFLIAGSAFCAFNLFVSILFRFESDNRGNSLTFFEASIFSVEEKHLTILVVCAKLLIVHGAERKYCWKANNRYFSYDSPVLPQVVRVSVISWCVVLTMFPLS